MTLIKMRMVPMFNLRRLAAAAAVLTVSGPVLAACGDDGGGGASAPEGAIEVEASFYPLAWIAERVGGEHVAVHSLTKAGAEPHDLELSPSDVADVLDADLVVYLDGFQPAVDDAVGQIDGDRRFDAADAGADLDLRFTPIEEGAQHDDEAGAVDPHFWLDTTRLGAVADGLADRLGDLDPDHAAEFTANAQDLEADLAALDSSFEAGLADCPSRRLVTSHNAFGYLARRYDLEQVGITGLTPEEEPSPADLAAVTDYVRQHGVGTIYFEALVSPAIAEAVAAETGAATRVLDPIEGLDDSSPGDDYLEVMAANLTALREGLGCR
jgi:zinc transport system substrate-binding protein